MRVRFICRCVVETDSMLLPFALISSSNLPPPATLTWTWVCQSGPPSPREDKTRMRARRSASEVDPSIPSYIMSVRCQAGVAQKPKCANPGKSSLQAPSRFPCRNATKQTIQSSEALF
ncbi:hypothetical protein LI328DRAFT_171387 [Trichoderma asperelloides]|nr:hypothetical protein LI328DRAFT_171387 [Trichoderma asperelloides]